MRKLSKKDYWSQLYDVKGFNKRSRIKNFFSYSLQNYEYFSIIKKFLTEEHKTILEIGCAPGGYLIKAAKIGLVPYGVDYTRKGAHLTKINLKNAGIRKFKVIEADVFDKSFLEQYEEKFDVVFSNGFVEHFDNFYKTMEIHARLCRKKGLVVISMPNLRYLNWLLSSKAMLEMTNLSIIEDNYLKKHIPSNLKMLYCNYYGGIFNTGLFSYTNKLVETLRTGLFIIQRLVFDPIFILFYKMGIKLNCKYSSPCIVAVYEKK